MSVIKFTEQLRAQFELNALQIVHKWYSQLHSTYVFCNILFLSESSDVNAAEIGFAIILLTLSRNEVFWIDYLVKMMS